MQPESGLFISSLSLAEIEKGILKLAGTNASSGASNARRAEHLTVWLGKLTERFADRTLPVDAAVWRVWAQQAALAELQGQTIAPMDGLLMATAQCHGLTVVTRNVADFARYPQVFNPWELA
ncbi:MAG: type II toxin-antitoxin system VapC family toxin [Polaromonas sp.]|uniref:type II toxin-antitoxin system VapC family toxin n=1 Tax=Polaromonas sp. TaxID=1869339 RepID=UPI002733624E|nr:type II toxin-antitoxin system VapC family toxin [Polaromonas sp.]MDP3796299.1 type II toxin-antitoxin system VapC family toxin [Polaromonas sp.]